MKMSPYEQILGAEFGQLCPGVQVAHRTPLLAEGFVDVERNGSWLSRIIGRLAKMPRHGQNLPTTLETNPDGDRVHWLRTIDGERFASTQRAHGNELVELCGPLTLRFLLTVEDGALVYDHFSTRLGAIPVPMRIRAVVRGEGDGWAVDIRITVPVVGVICAYVAHMKPL